MTKEEKIALKDKLKLFCQSVIDQRIQSAKAVINSAQQAANQEEKNSAGDKYETARAMGHLEKDLHTRQLAENLKELAALHAIGTHTLYISVTAGAFIRCNAVSFFIAAAIILFFLLTHRPLLSKPEPVKLRF